MLAVELMYNRASRLHVALLLGSQGVMRRAHFQPRDVLDFFCPQARSFLSRDGYRGQNGGSHTHIFRDTERVDLDDDWSGRAGGLTARGPDGSERPLGESVSHHAYRDTGKIHMSARVHMCIDLLLGTPRETTAPNMNNAA